MSDIKSIAFALDTANTPSFLLDWEVTKLCNLDCSYCPVGIEGGHDNSSRHPPLDRCLDTIDFMYEYVDLYMQHKKPSQRKVILNVYGGESLFHPDIVAILEACRSKYQKYSSSWYLTVTCTTNGVIGQNLLERILPLVDEFTVTFHAEALEKQRQQALTNMTIIKEHGVRVKCIVLMHNNHVMWDRCLAAIEFCKTHQIKYMSKPLDNSGPQWSYSEQQWAKLRPNEQPMTFVKSLVAIEQGRQCCGGRLLSTNGNLKSRETFIARQGFRGWSCSVNWFFLFVRQLDGAVYTNKDCETSTTGLVEPLGNLSNTDAIVQTLKQQLNGSMPIIKCVKPICMCGFCAPKAESELEFLELIKRNVPVDIFQKTC
jgi:pyruvate-formate lyase-activating enzyme